MLEKQYVAAVVAERLRRLTRNQIPSWSVGSNPTDCDRITSAGSTFCKFLFVVKLQLNVIHENQGPKLWQPRLS